MTVDYIVDGQGCWVWQRTIRSDGYGSVYVPEDRCNRLAHRVYYSRRYGMAPDTLDHTCRNPRCVNPEHLEPISRGENVRRGKRSIVTWEGAAFIRRSEISGVELARMFGVHKTTIYNIRAGRFWDPAKRPTDRVA